VDLIPADLPVLANLGGLDEARSWLGALPALVAEVRDEFELELQPPLRGGSCSWVAPATLPDGTPVIVKIGWPHPEMYGEPVALRLWDGHGAVRLLRHDPARHALLLSRCTPGVELGRCPLPPEDRLGIAGTVLGALWSVRPPEPPSGPGGTPVLERLGDVTADWADRAEQRMDRIRPGYDPGLVAEGIGLLRLLPASAGREVILHGDFNPGNVLSHDGTWLAIDPKPMVGDPAYDPWPMLEQIDDPFARPGPVAVFRSRAALLGGLLSLEPDRIIAWSVARRVETALWAAGHGDLAGGAAVLAGARVLAGL
jgi:streptomycin 6-kinase